jgi:hypothetical protein
MATNQHKRIYNTYIYITYVQMLVGHTYSHVLPLAGTVGIQTSS